MLISSFYKKFLMIFLYMKQLCLIAPINIYIRELFPLLTPLDSEEEVAIWNPEYSQG